MAIEIKSEFILRKIEWQSGLDLHFQWSSGDLKCSFIILIWKIFEVERKIQKVLSENIIYFSRSFCLFFNQAKEKGDDLNL